MTLLAEVTKDAWAMEPRALEAFARLVAGAPRFPDAALPGAGSTGPAYQLRDGGVAVIGVKGVLMKQVPRWFAWYGVDATGYGDLRASLAAAVDDKKVKSIVLHVESPGGQVAGGMETADAIAAAAARKPVHAVVEDLAASGAYWLASQASSITANASAMVGSIGVYSVWPDYSAAAEKEGVTIHVVRSGEHKGMGVPGAPISDAQLAAMQEVIDGMAAQFMDAVGRGRRMKPEQVKAVATGRVWLASEAAANGLIDQVEPPSAAIDRHVRASAKRNTMADEKSETKSESTIRSEVLATERKRARDMRAAFPEAPDFAAEQLEAGATVDEALAAFVPVLREKLTASAARVAQLEGELAAARAESAKPAPAGKKTVLPVAQEGTPGASQGDFMTQARAYAKEHGVGITAAMSAIARDNRELHRSYVASTKTVKEPRE